MSIGMGIRSFLGTAIESPSSYGTPVSPTQFVPFTREGVQGNIEWRERYSAGMSQLAALQESIQHVSGGFSTPDMATLPQLMRAWNGADLGSPNLAQAFSQALPGSITAAPTAALHSGGTLTNLAHHYRVAQILERFDGALFITNPSPTSNGVTTGSGGLNSVVVAWVNASVALVGGYTVAGTVIYRRGGGIAEETFLTFVFGTQTSFTDTGSIPLSNIPFPAPVFQYTFTAVNFPQPIANPSPATNPAVTFGIPNRLPSLTITKRPGIPGSLQYSGCRLDKMALSLARGSVATFAFTLMGQSFAQVTDPSYTESDPFFAPEYGCQLLIGGTQLSVLKEFSLSGDNKLKPLLQASGAEVQRDFWPGIRSLTGDAKIILADYTQWTAFKSASIQNFQVQIDGQPITPGTTFPGGPIPWCTGMEIYMPNVTYISGDIVIDSRGLLIQPLKWKANTGTGTYNVTDMTTNRLLSTAYDMTVVLYGTASSV